MPNPSYSLWLMPPPPVRDRFARLIETLARRLGTPRFEPHVTLGGGADLTEEEALARAQTLARRLAPVPVHLTEVAYTDEYFRCLFVLAERSAELATAHRLACEGFGKPPAADFMPHLSLVYGALGRDQKERVIDEIGRRFDVSFSAANIGLCLPSGPPPGWRLLGPFPLTGGGDPLQT